MEDILERAMSWASQHHASASMPHKAAFANSVQYLVTGGSNPLPAVRLGATAIVANLYQTGILKVVFANLR